MSALKKVEVRAVKLGTGRVSKATIIAGVLLAVLQVVNQIVLDAPQVRDVIAVVLGAAAAYGIQPLFGPGLTNLLHIPAKTLFFVAGLIAALNGIVSVMVMSTALHTILAGVLTLVGAIVFGSPIGRNLPVAQPVPSAPVTPAPL